ncbi:MAG: DUF4157 domain-containing protein [Blastocatellia bacterium]
MRPVRGEKLPLHAQQILRPYFPELNLARVRVRHGIPWYVLMDADAYTDRQTIFFREGRFDPESLAGLSLIAHELTHCWQYDQLGTWRFRRRYVGAWLRGMVRTRSWVQAYLNIPFEIEARQVEVAIYHDLMEQFPA